VRGPGQAAYAPRPRNDAPPRPGSRDARPWDRPRDDRGQGGRPDQRGPGNRPDQRGRPDRYGPPVRRPLAPSLEGIALADDEEIVAGRRPVEEAFVARREARRLLVVPQRRMALEKLVLHATNLRIPVVEVEGGSLTAIAGFDGHQGIALVVGPRRWSAPDDILALAGQRQEAPLVLVLDSLEDPQNVGTLLRTAEASGVHGAIFPTRHQAPLTPAAIKASAGAVEHLQLAPVDDLPAALADLHSRGLRIVGADGDAPLTAREADLRGPVAIVVGSEGKGLGPAVRRRCDLLVRIPMHGRIDSLNASVAGSILLYEAASQRGTGSPPQPGDGDHAEAAATDAATPTGVASEDIPEAVSEDPSVDEAAEAPLVDPLPVDEPRPRSKARKTTKTTPSTATPAAKTTRADTQPTADTPTKATKATKTTTAASTPTRATKPAKAEKAMKASKATKPTKQTKPKASTGSAAPSTPAATTVDDADDLLPGGPPVDAPAAPVTRSRKARASAPEPPSEV
jgi:23S rRNA (guanosine2251-2'-O)-methyltransferase